MPKAAEQEQPAQQEMSRVDLLQAELDDVKAALAGCQRTLRAMSSFIAHSAGAIFCQDVELGRRDATRLDPGMRRFAAGSNRDQWMTIHGMVMESIGKGETVEDRVKRIGG